MDILVKPGTHASLLFHVVRRRKLPELGDLIEGYPATDPDRGGNYGSRTSPSRWAVDGITHPHGPEGEPFYWLRRE